MKPIVFGGRFGWLHEGRGDRGVILCNTLGHESVWTRNGMRHMAEELAARGIWALRFDYIGTGDSAGADGTADQFESAVFDIETAIEWFRQETGVAHVTLCGLRVGAALVLSAARHRPVDDIVLLAPVISGRAYLRELTMVRKTWFDQLPAPVQAVQPASGPLNVLGQIYSDELKLSLETFDAAAIMHGTTCKPAARVLIAHVRAAASESLRSALIAHDVSVEYLSFDEFTAFAQESVLSELPAKTFASVIEWIAPGRARSAQVSPGSASWSGDLMIETPEAVDRPVLIGERQLFGILCEPRTVLARNSVLLIANTSASAHVGDSRLSVRIARELARRGIASLRYDARGRGDSPAEEGDVKPGKPFTHIYAPCATEDTADAARWLAAKGFRNIVSFGICSGAYHALRAAIVEPALTGVVTVNIPTFTMPQPPSPDRPRDAARNSLAGYAISVFEPAKWKRVFRGERRIMPIVKFIASNLTTRVRTRVVDALGLDRRQFASSKEVPAEPGAMLHALNEKGVRTVLVYGIFDSSMDILAAHFGKHGRRLSRYESVRVAVFDDIDHALFAAASSAKVIALCDTLLKEMSVTSKDAPVPDGTPAIS
ncbi:serine aminopeptidase domain-containing protein [Caballeronia telluris]|uniref:Alpha/beta hydrolase n=1 Tax=Caballeronia telluris TaxID=326475 RepID=A0A158GK54_9BURK|nr:alpha/beta hydrolase [Caballeronia telluris]SAL32191.1 alpha/beta hydrolase [Caballeronia telluris]